MVSVVFLSSSAVKSERTKETTCLAPASPVILPSTAPRLRLTPEATMPVALTRGKSPASRLSYL